MTNPAHTPIMTDCEMCQIGQDLFIRLCPMHKAAPELLAYIKKYGGNMHGSHTGSGVSMNWRKCIYSDCQEASQLLAKAEGKG